MWPGWHGGPTTAESRVPFWVGMPAMATVGGTFVDRALITVFGDETQPRLSHVKPLIIELFKNAGRGNP